MNNILRKIEEEEFIFYKENQYDPTKKYMYLEVFNSLVSEGKIKGKYSDSIWMGYSGIKWYGIRFEVDIVAYNNHAKKEIKVPGIELIEMLKCYVLYLSGEFIFSSIAKRIRTIRKFLISFGGMDYKISYSDISAVYEFLYFINITPNLVEDIINKIHQKTSDLPKQRKLEHLINYLVIGNEVNYLFDNSISDTEFKKWFPIYFWVNITFVLPLRATEMLVTPFDCIKKENGNVYLSVRRTLLKGHSKDVYYEVKKDYELVSYKIPDNEVVQNIIKYQELTSDNNRRFLFEHSKYSINKMVLLPIFNNLIKEFVERFLVGNKKYDFARFATDIDEFQVVTAGDSRPIAMANLFFQDIGADICRQLAGHVHISTSSGYYTNISDTILCSSVIQMQRKINNDRRKSKEYEQQYKRHSIIDRAFSCLSKKRMADPTNIEDCIKEKHLEECFGCKYYLPSTQELQVALKEREKQLQKSAAEVMEFMNNVSRAAKKNLDIDKLFLDAQTDMKRYKIASDKKMEELKNKWLESKTTRTNCS